MVTKLAKQQAKYVKITLDNLFITEYMPFCPESYIKVYLLGLSLAFTGDETNNSLQYISTKLSMDEASVCDAFRYFQEQGIMNIVSYQPLEVEYLPVTPSVANIKKFSKTKYKDFNSQLNAMIPNRNILPNEYNEYYSIMEAMHIEPNAMLAIIAYCIRVKGENVAYSYILAVARNLAHQGCLTYDRVNEQLSEFDLYDADLRAVLKSLSSKKTPDHEDKKLYIKWTKSFGFKLETIIAVAKKIKHGDMNRLDNSLTKYYENHLFTLAEIEKYITDRDKLYELTRNINKIIGVYYEQLDFIIETYITPWLNYGFTSTALLDIASYCFTHNKRTLQAMADIVEKLYKQGIVSTQSIQAFINETNDRDKVIKSIFELAHYDKTTVTSSDRDAYHTWKYNWKMSDEVIKYCASLSQNAINPITYMNAVLSNWYTNGISTVEQAKKANINNINSSKKDNVVKKTYTSEQMNAVFDGLDNDEIW